ncbi:MAG TPA: hypothetical protein PLK46_12940 [Propioniciclava sp.]|uniref:hypothetical protein n=1 Tax=Propioniciclava sp. TaxID=2038686 RepID=UPI002CB7EDB0|nr:hypothetical protein [Propioniciclava sp.]HRL81223.1 hypothetical protein [Propioniciclava sp.]
MDGELELMSDGNGLAVIGAMSDVERFFQSSGLDHLPSRGFDPYRIRAAVNLGGGIATAGVTASTEMGRWVKLTEESAQAFKSWQLMKGPTEGVSRAIAVNGQGRTQHILQIVTKPGSALTNPAILGGLGAVMSQYAMQQQMNEIGDYLELINEKVDDILRAQKDAVLADMIGVDLTIEDALIVRDEVGHVSEITWSKVQTTSQTLARTQAYALRELDAIAEKLTRKADIGEVAKGTREAEPRVREWLAVLARTFQLQDGVSILELDRVLNAAPDELDSHHAGLLKARQNRLERIGRSTAALLTQMDETVRNANAKVLTNPFDSPAAVRSSNQIASEVQSLRERLGIASTSESAEAKRWGQAVGEVVDKVRAGTIAAKRLGDETFNHATEVFRAVDLDGDGIPEPPRAATAAAQASEAIKGAAAGVSGAVGILFQRKRADNDRLTPSETKQKDAGPPGKQGAQ